MDKRETAYARARTELMTEMVRGGLFDMDEHQRGENVSRIVRHLQARYPGFDAQMTRRLVGEGMQRNYGEAMTSESARKGRSMD